MTLMTSQNISPRLLKALGLPNRTCYFRLEVDARMGQGHIATVHCEYHPDETSEAIADVITTEYELVERKPT